VRASEGRPGVRAGGDEHGHGLGAAREVPGPVGQNVQQRPLVPTLVGEAGGRERGVLGDQALEALDVTGVDGLEGGHGARIARVHAPDRMPDLG
jgi:hypothetical protein